MSGLTVVPAEERVRSAFSFAGCSWALTTNDSGLAAAFGSAFPAGADDAAAMFHLDLQTNAAGEGRWPFPYFRARDHLVLAAFSPSDVLIFDLLGRRGAGTISRALADDHNYWRRVIVPALIGLASPSVGIAPLHCATLVRNGMALHISGLSGAGKSTLAYALSQRGHRLLSDDWTYFTRGRHGLVAHGLPVPIKLLPDSQRFFPELRTHAITCSLNGEHAYELDVAHSLSPARTYSAMPSRLLFYRRERLARPRAMRMTPQQVEAQFRPALERIPECLARGRETQHAIITALANLPAYSLVCDGSPQQIAGWIDEFILGDCVAAGMEDTLPPAHFEVPDLMLRFTPAPLIRHRSDSGIRIETNIPAVHEYSSELAERLREAHGNNLDCTFIADSADWPAAKGAFGKFAFRCLPNVGCMFLDRNARRMVAFLASPSLESMIQLVAHTGQ